MGLKCIFVKVKTDLVQGENHDAYGAITLGFVFTVLGVVGQVKQEWLNSFILLTLTLLLIISLKNRYLIQDNNLLLKQSDQSDVGYCLKDRSEYESLDRRLSGASESIIIGNHLLGFVGYNKDLIRKYAKQGCCFKFVMVDPKLSANSASKYDIERSLLVLAKLARDCPNKIQVRLTCKKLPCAIFTVDLTTSKGLIQIQPHPIFNDSDLRAHYDLRASSESKWYNHYREQIGLLWNDSSEHIECSADNNSLPENEGEFLA